MSCDPTADGTLMCCPTITTYQMAQLWFSIRSTEVPISPFRSNEGYWPTGNFTTQNIPVIQILLDTMISILATLPYPAPGAAGLATRFSYHYYYPGANPSAPAIRFSDASGFIVDPVPESQLPAIFHGPGEQAQEEASSFWSENVPYGHILVVRKRKNTVSVPTKFCVSEYRYFPALQQIGANSEYSIASEHEELPPAMSIASERGLGTPSVTQRVKIISNGPCP